MNMQFIFPTSAHLSDQCNKGEYFKRWSNVSGHYNSNTFSNTLYNNASSPSLRSVLTIQCRCKAQRRVARVQAHVQLVTVVSA